MQGAVGHISFNELLKLTGKKKEIEHYAVILVIRRFRALVYECNLGRYTQPCGYATTVHLS